MPRSRVVTVGFHGGGPYYMRPLLEAGRLPTLQRLSAEGLTAVVTSTWPVSAACWVTLLTGLDVEQHGVVDVCEFDARWFPSLSARFVDATAYADQTFFSFASRAGRSVAGLGVPMTAPAWPVEGVLVPSFPVPDECFPPTWPPRFLDRFGPVSLCQADAVDLRDADACRAFLDYDLTQMSRMGRAVYQERDWDFFLLVFKVPDLVNHLLCENPHVPDWRRTIDEYLERTDAAMGEFLATVDPDSTVIVMSDHGCGPKPDFTFRVSTWLEEEELLVRRHRGLLGVNGLARLHAAYRRLRGAQFARRIRRRLPDAVVDRVRAVGHQWPFVDMARTTVYPVDVFFPLAGFEVNLAGRQPGGVVAPSDFDRVIERLVSRLARLTIPDTAAPLCRRIFRREELYDGPFAERLPDVVAELDPSVEADLHLAPGLFGKNSGKASLPYQGYHSPDALYVMRGPGIPAGRSVSGAHVRDFMPTVMRLLDLPVPTDRRGCYVPDLV